MAIDGQRRNEMERFEAYRDDRLIRTIDVASRLGVSKDFVYALIDRGRLTPVRLGLRVLRFRESDLIRLLVEGS